MCAAARGLAPAAGKSELSGSSAKHAPCPAGGGCSLGGFDCADTISLQICCWIWSLALLPVIKGVKLCHGLNSAVAAKFFPSTLNCLDLGVS